MVFSWFRKTKKANTSAKLNMDPNNPFAKEPSQFRNVRKNVTKSNTVNIRKEKIDFEAVVAKFISYLNEKRSYTRKYKEIKEGDEKFLKEDYWGTGTEPIPGNSVARRVAARGALRAEQLTRAAAEGIGEGARVTVRGTAEAAKMAYESLKKGKQNTTRRLKESLKSDYTRALEQLDMIRAKITAGNFKNKGELTKEIREMRGKLLNSKRYGRRLNPREIAKLSDDIEDIKEDFIAAVPKAAPAAAAPAAAAPAAAVPTPSPVETAEKNELSTMLDNLLGQVRSLAAGLEPKGSSAAAAAAAPGNLSTFRPITPNDKKKGIIDEFDDLLDAYKKETNVSKRETIKKDILSMIEILKQDKDFTEEEKDEIITSIEQQLK